RVPSTEGAVQSPTCILGGAPMALVASAPSTPPAPPDTAYRTMVRRGRSVRVRLPRGYRYDPGPESTISYIAMSVAAVERRYVVCPRCGAPVEHEPAFIHCVMCGRYYPVVGASLNRQRDYEVFAAYSTLRPKT